MPPTTKQQLGRWVRSLRRNAGYSQEGLAGAVATDARQLKRYESGQTEMGALLLLRIFGVTDVTVDPPPPEKLAPIPRLQAELEAEVERLRRLNDELEAELGQLRRGRKRG